MFSVKWLWSHFHFHILIPNNHIYNSMLICLSDYSFIRLFHEVSGNHKIPLNTLKM